MKEKKGEKTAAFTSELPAMGVYEVRIAHNSNVRRAPGMSITIHHSKGTSVVEISENEPAPLAKLFRSIGRFHFQKGRKGSVVIGTKGAEGKYVIVDAVKFIPTQEHP